ncbi:MAG: gamma carbonic anhydrase family protein [Gammaproteobacteria bacterium]
MNLISLEGKAPEFRSNDFWVAPNATLIGNVVLENEVSIWFNATLRGDNEPIVIGEGSNIQDGTVIHTDPGFKCTVGRRVTVGHMVMLHGCQIGDGSLIGIGSVIMNGAIVGRNCIIGAKALITEGMVIPDGSLVIGMPGKIARSLSENEQKIPSLNAAHYINNYKRYK